MVKKSMKSSKIKSLPNMKDARKAGTKESESCTLILTEGESGYLVAVSGLDVIGRDYYGIFALYEKLPNVSESSETEITQNLEITNLMTTLGLQYGKEFIDSDDFEMLRYGKVMLLTDPNNEGYYMKGLFINFINSYWPELLKTPFLEEFITPLVKVSKSNEIHLFYTIPQFEEWRNETPNFKAYTLKYYKTLGAATCKEVKEYFMNMQRHRIIFKFKSKQDDEFINLAFNKDYIERRKIWLSKHFNECNRRKAHGLPECYLTKQNSKPITFTDFFNHDYLSFLCADKLNTIPSVIDGLTVNQRKVLFTCLKCDKHEMNVVHLNESVIDQTNNHLIEVSLQKTIIKMAHNFVGSNNVNLLQPHGQFGTRLAGGEDCDSDESNLITCLSPLTRLIYHSADDHLLINEISDTGKNEPDWFIPIIPMILVNGADNVGKVWSTKICCYNPRDIIRNLRRMIAKDDPVVMNPWYRNFKGQIIYVGSGCYLSFGNIQVLPNKHIEITELPIGMWTTTYREEILEPLLQPTTSTNKPIITDYKEYHTEKSVRFVITFHPLYFHAIEKEEGGFYRVLRLSSLLSTNQMYTFDRTCSMRKFAKPLDILREFYTLRLEYYVKRKKRMTGKMLAEATRLSEQVRFIIEKCQGNICVENEKCKPMINELQRRQYQPDPIKEWKEGNQETTAAIKVAVNTTAAIPSTANTHNDTAQESKKAPQKTNDVKKFNYLLGLPLWMLTDEPKTELIKQRDQKIAALAALRAKSPEILWLEDLSNLEKKLNEIDSKEQNETIELRRKQGTTLSTNIDSCLPDPNGVRLKFVVTDEIMRQHNERYCTSLEEDKNDQVKKMKPIGDGTHLMASNSVEHPKKLKSECVQRKKKLTGGDGSLI